MLLSPARISEKAFALFYENAGEPLGALGRHFPINIRLLFPMVGGATLVTSATDFPRGDQRHRTAECASYPAELRFEPGNVKVRIAGEPEALSAQMRAVPTFQPAVSAVVVVGTT